MCVSAYVCNSWAVFKGSWPLALYLCSLIHAKVFIKEQISDRSTVPLPIPTLWLLQFVPCQCFLYHSTVYTCAHRHRLVVLVVSELSVTIKCVLPLGYCFPIVHGLCVPGPFVSAWLESACLLWLNGSRERCGGLSFASFRLKECCSAHCGNFSATSTCVETQNTSQWAEKNVYFYTFPPSFFMHTISSCFVFLYGSEICVQS